jgi:hypothetical protein
MLPSAQPAHLGLEKGYQLLQLVSFGERGPKLAAALRLANAGRR